MTAPHTLPPALDGVLDAVALLLTQSRLGEEVSATRATVKDIRVRIAGLFHDVVSVCNATALHELDSLLDERLANLRRICADGAATAVQDHADYCIREVRVCFEMARQVCRQHDAVELRQHLLADIPILRPFDYLATRRSDQQASAESTATVTTSS